jgi:predicted alpha-1,2-mannosidase
MIKIFYHKLSLLILVVVCFIATKVQAQRPIDYVKPHIGTGLHGHVFLGANVPFGAVQLGSVNLSQGWDWCSGYNDSDSTIIGFAHTRLSGTGIGDLGDILVLPSTGKVILDKGSLKHPGNFSLFSHKDEKTSPGYYSVLLKRYNIKAELTASTRVGFHQYTFPASEQSHILVDLTEGIGWDRPTDAYIKKINDSTLVGYRYSKGWSIDQRIFFAMVFSKPFKNFSLYKSKQKEAMQVAMGDSIKAVADFTTVAGEKISIKVAISPVSFENAFLNLTTEVPHWNFNQVKAEAEALWSKELDKITVKTKDEKRKEIFYTALYHTMIAPSVFNDVNGDYFGADKQIYRNASFNNLTTFSLWDTYRACNGLYTLYQPERVSDMVNSMLAIYKQQGRLPVWHLMGSETYTMPGNSSIQVVGDAYLKGIKGIDPALAYEAMKTTTLLDDRGLKFLKNGGYIPADSMTESVAMGMEYSISDGAIAQMAKQLGKTDDYTYFSKRAGFYKNYYDKSTGFVRGRLSDTKWRQDFSPFESRHRKDDFSEGNAWQYTWLAPHDVHGLINLMGGEKKFTQKLDSLFIVHGDMGEEASNDISGLIGQYAHGNEPSHHITYLYGYAGQPYKTAEKVRYILDSMYTTKPDGIIGNEDVGQMSAWYIFSAMGFYPVHPSGGIYIFGSPVMDEAVIRVGKDKTFKVTVKNNSATNKYIQKMSLNNQAYTKAYILHSELVKGGELIIEMGNKPSKTWGIAPADRPPF